jgi:predicted metal-dependent hydrolase
MPSVKYGKQTIHFTVHEQSGLRSHYISVEPGRKVIIKGSRLAPETAQRLILKKAKWIVDKLGKVKGLRNDDIVTGSRIAYLGRQYYAAIKADTRVADARLIFNHSSFKLLVNPGVKREPAIKKAIAAFYKEKAVEKILPRLEKWSKDTGLIYKKAKFMKMGKRWGSCTADNNIVLNPEAIKLPYSMIDYLLVHELCHTMVKDHSKRFWKEVGKHMREWKQYDDLFKENTIY